MVVPVRPPWFRKLQHGGRVVLDRFLPAQPEDDRVADAHRYWSDPMSPDWATNSHWREALGDEWAALGEEHRDRVLRLRRLVSEERCEPLALGRVVEWGCGGGANAVALAPLATEFVAVDIAEQSLAECRVQATAAGVGQLRTLHVDAEQPEAVLPILGAEAADLFVCFYVFELLPSQQYAMHILEVARQLLKPGGLAVVQLKYTTASWRTQPRRRSYRHNLANMTTFGIDEFWTAAQRAGWEPLAVQLAPSTRLDERQAYYALRKPALSSAVRS